MSAAYTTSSQWVRFNPQTYTYDTPDGTHIAAELADSTQCFWDFVRIAEIREQQRAAIAQAQEPQP